MAWKQLTLKAPSRIKKLAQRMFKLLRLFCVYIRFVCNGYATIKILRLSLDDDNPVISFEGGHQRKFLVNSSQVCKNTVVITRTRVIINISLHTI